MNRMQGLFFALCLLLVTLPVQASQTTDDELSGYQTSGGRRLFHQDAHPTTPSEDEALVAKPPRTCWQRSRTLVYSGAIVLGAAAVLGGLFGFMAACNANALSTNGTGWCGDGFNGDPDTPVWPPAR